VGFGMDITSRVKAVSSCSMLHRELHTRMFPTGIVTSNVSVKTSLLFSVVTKSMSRSVFMPFQANQTELIANAVLNHHRNGKSRLEQ